MCKNISNVNKFNIYTRSTYIITSLIFLFAYYFCFNYALNALNVTVGPVINNGA